PRTIALSSVSADRPPIAALGLVTLTPGIGSLRTVSVPAATLPSAPPPHQYQHRISRLSAGTGASGVSNSSSLPPGPGLRSAGANVMVPVIRSATNGSSPEG